MLSKSKKIRKQLSSSPRQSSSPRKTIRCKFQYIPLEPKITFPSHVFYISGVLSIVNFPNMLIEMIGYPIDSS